MQAQELLRYLTYGTLVQGSWKEDDMWIMDNEQWKKITWAEDGVLEYALDQGADLPFGKIKVREPFVFVPSDARDNHDCKLSEDDGCQGCNQN